MNLKLQISVIILLQVVNNIRCTDNNVCPTLKDYYTVKDNPNCWYDFSANLSAIGIIVQHGYPVEIHKVATPDGYILRVFRIPNYHSSFKRGPVFLQHGWLNSAGVFVARGRDSLAFLLADAGYDVWIGNFRGTEYSEGHINLTTSDKRYWDYSSDEIGLYDIPSQLELVTAKTGQRGNIIYIGHSLGTTSALMYASAYPDLAKQTVQLFLLLAPAGNLANMKSLFFRILAPFFGLLLKVIELNDLMRITSQADPMRTFIRKICLESPLLMQRCLQAINLLVNGPRTQMEPRMIPIYFNHVPAGTSFKVARHIADSSLNHFRQYNYGFGNFRRYRSFFPPQYDVSRIRVPVFLMYAVNDWACTKKDSINLYNSLPSQTKIYGLHEITDPNFNHLDFFFGKNAKSLVYDPVMRLIENLSFSPWAIHVYKYTNVTFNELEGR